MTERMQELLRKKDIRGALEELKKSNSNAALLLADYENELNYRNLGAIKEDQWQAYVDELLLRIKQLTEEGETQGAVAEVKEERRDEMKTVTPGPTVFLSYNIKDWKIVEAVAAYLRERHFDLFLDRVSMVPGDVIQKRMTKEIIERDFFVVLLSEHSLRSTWVGLESSTASTKLLTETNRVIPLKIDGALHNLDTLQDIQLELLENLNEMDKRIDKSRQQGLIGLKFLNEERQRRADFLNQYDNMISAYQNLHWIDIAGEQFQHGMEMLVATLRRLTEEHPKK